MTGNIHSIETFGTVDGPGVRFVVFFQGSPLRCLYCHNPDTWSSAAGHSVTAMEIIARLTRNQAFYRSGGLTASGGEPMLQLPFLTELFTLAKQRGIHTCLDTSGILFDDRPEQLGQTDRLLAVTDLVMLDIKHTGEEAHRKLTGSGNRNILAFARYLDTQKIPVWIRHVVVPGITYDKPSLTALGTFLGTLSNVEKLEVLPYHTLGKAKYDNLNLKYALQDTPQLTDREAADAEQIILKAWKENA